MPTVNESKPPINHQPQSHHDTMDANPTIALINTDNRNNKNDNLPGLSGLNNKLIRSGSGNEHKRATGCVELIKSILTAISNAIGKLISNIASHFKNTPKFQVIEVLPVVAPNNSADTKIQPTTQNKPSNSPKLSGKQTEALSKKMKYDSDKADKESAKTNEKKVLAEKVDTIMNESTNSKKTSTESTEQAQKDRIRQIEINRLNKKNNKRK